MYGRRADAVVGYTADAGIWCPACAALMYDRIVDGVLRIVGDDRIDFWALDFEGNYVSPIFSSDDTAGLVCSRCGEDLDA